MSARTTPAAPAAPAAPTAKVGPYRTVPAWHAAHAAAVGAHRGNAAARATCGVLTHLAWRAPHAAMLAHAESLGVTVGMPVAAAVAACVAALPAGPTTKALAKETAALAPAPKK